MKKVGYINGIAVYEDPDCPPGQLYFLSDKYMDFRVHNISVTRWQAAKLWIRRLLNKLN